MSAVQSGNKKLDIQSTRERFSMGVLALVWLCVAIACGKAVVESGVGNAWPVLCISLVLAALPTISLKTNGAGSATANTLSVALAGVLAVLVYEFKWDGNGVAYQIDMHMTFFAGLAIIGGLLDWRALIAYTGVVAVHHLGGSLLMPAAVFPDGAPLVRVFMHGGIIALQCGAMIWLVQQILTFVAEAQTAIETANAAKLDADEHKKRAEAMSAEDAQRLIDMKAMAANFRSDVESLMTALDSKTAELESTAHTMEASSQQSMTRSETLAQATRNASNSVETAAAATEELSASIAEIFSQINQTNSVVDQANGSAEPINVESF